MNLRKPLLILLVPFVIFGIIATLFSIYQTKQGESRRKTTLTVNFDSSQIEKVIVYDKSQTVGDGESKKLGEAVSSPVKTEVTKNSNIAISYTAKDGYESSETTIEIGNDASNIDIKPSYSAGKLSGLLPSSEVNIINKIITTKYTSFGTGYTINTGQLLGDGDWYGTTITPNYKDIFYGDTYRIILRKDSGATWTIKTKPEIIVSKPIYPEIPPEIINKVNLLN